MTSDFTPQDGITGTGGGGPDAVVRPTTQKDKTVTKKTADDIPSYITDVPPWEPDEGRWDDQAPPKPQPKAKPDPTNVVHLPPPPRGKKYGRFYYLTDDDANSAGQRDYYLKGLLSPGEMSIFYGEPGCGKSFLALYIARAIAQANPIFGRRVKGTKVLFLALEGVSGFEKRLKAAIMVYDGAEAFGYIAQPVNLFQDPKTVDEIIAICQDIGVGLLIIDTLNRAIAGGNENAPEDMGKFIANVDAIRTATEAHIMIIHHSGKDSSKGMRGHSALLGAADVAVEVAKATEGKTRSATVRKAKDDADGDTLSFELEVVELGTDDDGDQITTCIVRETEAPAKATTKADVLKPEERLWLDTLKELFARDENIEVVVPEDGMPLTACATRDAVREWIKKRGLVGASHKMEKAGVLSATDRSKFARGLQALKIKGKIGIHGDWVWMV